MSHNNNKYISVFDFIYFMFIFCLLSLSFPLLSLLRHQVHIDNEKCRREREARLSGSKLDLSFCGTRVATTAPTTATSASATAAIRTSIDSHGNSLPPLTPQSTGSNNNASPTHDETDKFTSMTPAGKLRSFFFRFNFYIQYNTHVRRFTFGFVPRVIAMDLSCFSDLHYASCARVQRVADKFACTQYTHWALDNGHVYFFFFSLFDPNHRWRHLDSL